MSGGRIPYVIEGHAIISDDDRIADASGQTPSALRNDADWRYFQNHLDQAVVTVLGRLGHEANPNVKNRRRLIVSSASPDLEQREDGWWWNPAEMSFLEAVSTAAPEGGLVAVPGGQGIFDLFLEIGYDAFHLVRARGVLIGAGRRLFSACTSDYRVEAVLAGHGLQQSQPIDLDPENQVSLTVWRR